MKKKYIEEYAVESAPIFKLSECIKLKSEDYKTDDEPNKPDEAEEAEAEAEQIMAEFRHHLYFFDEEQIEFVNFLAGQMRSGGLVITDDDITMAGLYPFEYFTAFLNEEKLYLVLPDELREIYEQTTAEASFEPMRKHNREMNKYAMALANLYGACETGQFAAVWNQHHKDKIGQGDVERFMEQSCVYAYEYFLEGDYVFSQFLQNDDEIDDLLDSVSHMAYYMPPKSVITLYGEVDYQENIPEANAVVEFLNRYVPNDALPGDMLRYDIILKCRRLEEPIGIVNTLSRHGFPVQDKEAMKEFERVYKNFFENTHMWAFRGFTPSQYELETQNKVKPFKIPEFVAVKNKKNSKKKK